MEDTTDSLTLDDSLIEREDSSLEEKQDEETNAISNKDVISINFFLVFIIALDFVDKAF